MLRIRPERWLSLVVVVVGVGTAWGRGPREVGLKDLMDEGRKPNIREILPQLFRGDLTANPNDKDHLAAIDYQARLDTYRFANSQFHVVGGTDPSMTIARLFTEFDRDVQELAKNKEKTKECARLFSRDVIKYGKEVLEVPLPIAQVNITRVLARLAPLGNPDLADALADIVKDPQHNDGVKYWAMRGLRDLLALMADNPQLLGKEREQKVGTALIEFITRKVDVSAITPPEEVEGLRVVRREAIRALGQLRIPALPNKQLPALVLLRIVAKEDATLPPRMDERLEAALGIARLRTEKNDKDYQPGYAACQVALFLAEFATYSVTVNKDDHRPCKIYAAQLADAFDALKKDANDPIVNALFDTGKPGQKLLDSIEKGRQADPAALQTAAETATPPVDHLFKSQPDSKVKPPTKE